MAFDQDQLEDYLRHQLELAEGEWFRTQKISGVAQRMMLELDGNQDGVVDWNEFQAAVAHLESALGLDAEGATADEVVEASGASFDIVAGESDQVSMGGLQDGIKQALPSDSEHLDLVSQFAARLAVDLADTDQRDLPVAQRTLSKDEWVSAAKDLASS